MVIVLDTVHAKRLHIALKTVIDVVKVHGYKGPVENSWKILRIIVGRPCVLSHWKVHSFTKGYDTVHLEVYYYRVWTNILFKRQE